MEAGQDKKGQDHLNNITMGMDTLTVAIERNSLNSDYVQELFDSSSSKI